MMSPLKKTLHATEQDRPDVYRRPRSVAALAACYPSGRIKYREHSRNRSASRWLCLNQVISHSPPSRATAKVRAG